MRSSGTVKVLIVDNDDRVLWKFQESLENAGFDTTATWSGQEALVLLKSGAFDVLLDRAAAHADSAYDRLIDPNWESAAKGHDTRDMRNAGDERRIIFDAIEELL